MRSADGARSGASGFRTHEFGFDPFERFRLAWRDPVRRRRVAFGAAALVLLTAVGVSFLSAGPSARETTVEAALADRERRLSELDAEIARRADKLAELDRRHKAAEAAIADGAKRIAALDAKRLVAEKELAELTAPVSPGGGPREAADLRAADPQPDADAAAPPSADLEGQASVAQDASASPADQAVDGAAAGGLPPAEAIAAATADRAGAGPVRVFIHIRSADRAARERANAVAAELRRRGVAVAEIRGVIRPVRRDAVRFFYDSDKEAVTTLQDAVRQASSPNDPTPQPQDFRSYGAPPRPGTLELWLS